MASILFLIFGMVVMTAVQIDAVYYPYFMFRGFLLDTPGVSRIDVCHGLYVSRIRDSYQ